VTRTSNAAAPIPGCRERVRAVLRAVFAGAGPRGALNERNPVSVSRSGRRSLANDLAEVFAKIQYDAVVTQHSSRHFSCRVLSEGKPRTVDPVVRDEVYRIGQEALINAFRHSYATNVAVEVKYCSNSLRVVVRDDGCGIEPTLLSSLSSAARWKQRGLPGMRGRAERIGARLRLWSAPRCGTELELSVPGHIAFDKPSAADCSESVNLHYWEVAG
jgi:signal transduction histidine kinase